jgi:DNA-binding response OmpR family regulator
MQTVLVAEDDGVLFDALERLLRDEGYEVVGVRNVEAAMRLLETCVVDGALVDWRLGTQWSDSLIELLLGQGVTVILLSGHPEARELADSFGIPCVHKPFVVEQLLGILGGAITRRTLRKIPSVWPTR